MPWGFELSFHERPVDDHLCRDIGKLGVAPTINGFDHWFEVPHHVVDAHGERVMDGEVFGVLREDGGKVSGEREIAAHKNPVADSDGKPEHLDRKSVV